MTPANGLRATDLHFRASDDPQRGFASHVDFLNAVISNSGATERGEVWDERLRALTVEDSPSAGGSVAFMLPAAWTPSHLLATAGSDEQGGYADQYGGFARQRALRTGLPLTSFEGDPTAGRTLRFEMDVPAVDILARTDQNHTTSVTGGLTVVRKPEAVAADDSRFAMELIGLHATTLMGFVYATEELLSSSPSSFAAIAAAAFGTEFQSTILKEKIRGLGGDQYLGLLHASCRITVAKETNQAADTIVSENVYNMAERCWGLNGAIWLANHNTRRQLYKLSLAIGTAGVALYQPPRTEGEPAMLLEAPLFFTEHCSTLGDEGDLILVNWSQYLEGTYKPLQSAESIHVRFVNHERALKFWTRNCGAPWWRAPLTPANSTGTLSPIVTLAARA